MLLYNLACVNTYFYIFIPILPKQLYVVAFKGTKTAILPTYYTSGLLFFESSDDYCFEVHLT